MRLIPAIAHGAWALASAGPGRRFAAALKNPAAAQADVLRRCLDENADTDFGRAHRFRAIRTIADFQRQVPMASYDDLGPHIRRIARGEPAVLTRDRVRRLQPSSGSTAAVKLIPYTRQLQREIGRAVSAWIFDLYRSHPALLGGRAYWSITPPAPAGDLPRAAVPVGFEDDSRYLGGATAAIAQATLVAPTFDASAPFDAARFRRTTLTTLLLTPDLRLISVWHPSFLVALLDTLAADWDQLLDAVARRDRRRAATLRALDADDDLRAIWPGLTVVSCWADGPASGPAAALAARLSGIALQPKGLIATEAVVSIPFRGRRPIALRSHFFEFEAPDGSVALAHELQPDVEYGVIVTTAGGLYRYRLGDRVRVEGIIDATPSIAFVGRSDRVSDLCGEKLSDGFVSAVIEALCSGRPRPAFAMLAPDRTATGLAYTLFTTPDARLSSDAATRLEGELRRNPHYALCAALGQLQPARIVTVRPGADRAYVDACVARGRRLGDVKPVSLDPHQDWRSWLPC